MVGDFFVSGSLGKVQEFFETKSCPMTPTGRGGFFISTIICWKLSPLNITLTQPSPLKQAKKSPGIHQLFRGESSRVCQQVVAFRRETSIVHNKNVRCWEWCWMSDFFKKQLSRKFRSNGMVVLVFWIFFRSFYTGSMPTTNMHIAANGKGF